MEIRNQILFGHINDRIKEVPDKSCHVILTSPPYWGLRDYKTAPIIFCLTKKQEKCSHKFLLNTNNKEIRRGVGLRKLGEKYRGGGKKQGRLNKIIVETGFCKKCGAWQGQLGHEPTPELYVKHLVLISREIKRVLRDDGTFWINLGDSYWGSGNSSGHTSETKNLGRKTFDYGAAPRYSLSQKKHPYLKPKDLCMIPFEVARALQKDGWYLRRDIVWCLSGGTHLYVKTQKGISISTIKDLYRLKPETVELWNGEKWTKLLGISKSKRTGEEIELVLRSGERISCTKTHQWPTNRGLIKAGDIRKGDCLMSTNLPAPRITADTTILNNEVAYFIGLYLAEGSHSGDTIQITGHKDEISRIDRLRKFVYPFGGSLTYTIKGNNLDIRIYGKILNSLMDTFISGKTAKDKCLNPVCWKYSNNFLMSILSGYLDGDGHYDNVNNRYRLGFTRNYNLERDLRTLAARLNFSLTLNPTFSKYQGGKKPSFKGEIRFETSNHFNNRNRNEVIEIRKSRAREFYDLGVADKPNLFALASGVLTHNSKPNPMPESVLDRPSTSHEYIFMFSKSRKYFYDSYAVRENLASNFSDVKKMLEQKERIGGKTFDNDDPNDKANHTTNIGKKRGVGDAFLGRNKRSVWEVTTKPFTGAHFATFPPDLITPIIKAGTSEAGCCASCGKPYIRLVEKISLVENKEAQEKHYRRREGKNNLMPGFERADSETKYDTQNDNAGRLATYRQGLRKRGKKRQENDLYESKYFEDHGQEVQGFIRSQSQVAERMFPGDKVAQQKFINYVHDHGLSFNISTVGWKKNCRCKTEETLPAIVFDPFFGSGTTGLVAYDLGRDYLGIELQPSYKEIQKLRLGHRYNQIRLL